MSHIEQTSAKPLMMRPWVPWLLGTHLMVTAWAFVDNVNDREWFLAGCFAVMTLSFIVQIIGLFWIRRRTNLHDPEEDEADAHRP
jgi:hypothetical protein